MRRIPLDRWGYPRLSGMSPLGDRFNASHAEAHRFMRAWFICRFLEHPEIPSELDDRHLEIHDLIERELPRLWFDVPEPPPMSRERFGFAPGHLARHLWEIEAIRLIDFYRPMRRMSWRIEQFLESERHDLTMRELEGRWPVALTAIDELPEYHPPRTVYTRGRL